MDNFAAGAPAGLMSNFAEPSWNMTQGAPAAQPLVCLVPPGIIKKEPGPYVFSGPPSGPYVKPPEMTTILRSAVWE